MVVIAPPEVARVMMRVAAELDHPNEFERHMLDREHEKLQLHRQIEEMKRQSAGRPRPPHAPQPAGPPPHAARGARGRRQGPPPPRGRPREGSTPEREEHQRIFRRKMEEFEAQQRRLQEELQEHVRRVHQQLKQIEQHKRRLAEDLQRRMHEERERQERGQRERGERERQERERQERGERPGPRGSMRGLPGLGLLLSPRLREELRLSDEQAERIRDVLAEVRKAMTHVMDRVREAAKDVPPQERGERVRQMMERVRAQGAERMRAVRERLMQILTPEQRKKVEQLLRGRRPPEPLPAQRPPERPKRPEPRDRPPRQPDKTHRPAVEKEAAEFHLIQNVAVTGSGAAKVEVRAAPGPAPSRVIQAAPGGGGRGSSGRLSGAISRWRGMDEAQRQEMVNRFRNQYAFRMLADEDIRAELDLTDTQEKKIGALIAKSEKERDRIQDDVRMQFGSNDADGPGAGDPAGHERQMRGETWQALRGAQSTFDKIMQETINTLTEEQKTKLQEVVRERTRLMFACGNLWILTTASAKEQLGLDDLQSKKIKKTLLEAADRFDEHRKALDEKRKAIQGANPGADSGQSSEAYRALFEGLRTFREESVKKTRERVFKLLTDEQKPKAEKLLAEADANQRSMFMGGALFGGGAMFGGMGGGGRSRAPERPPAGQPRIVPAVYDGAARFYLAKQDFDKPKKRKTHRKDRPKTEKPPKSKSTSADDKRGVVLLRLLQNPAVRAELGLSDEQEKRIFVLQEKLQRIQDSIRNDVRDVIGDRMKQARTPQDRSDIKRQAAEIAKEATRAAAGDMETIMKEAAEVLTPDQHAKLKTLYRHRAETARATGGLTILLAPKVREKIGISDEQADRIRLILQDVSKRAKDLRAESAGGRPPEDLKRRHDEMVRAARERVMGVLSAEQREMAERLLDRDPQQRARKRRPPEAAPATKGYGRAA